MSGRGRVITACVVLLLVGLLQNCGSWGTGEVTRVRIGLGTLCWLDPPPPAEISAFEGEDSLGLRWFSVDMQQSVFPEWAAPTRTILCAKDGHIVLVRFRLKRMSIAEVERLERWFLERWGPGRGMIVRSYTPADGQEFTPSRTLKWKFPTDSRGEITRLLFIEACDERTSASDAAAGAPVFCGSLEMNYSRSADN